jgi:hypothetical protein
VFLNGVYRQYGGHLQISTRSGAMSGRRDYQSFALVNGKRMTRAVQAGVLDDFLYDRRDRGADPLHAIFDRRIY